MQRESYSQWVIENRFAGPRPAWDSVGAQIVEDVSHYGRLKLHVLNACHSAPAYLGLPCGYRYVREAMADPELAQFLENLVSTEIAPGAGIPVRALSRVVRSWLESAAARSIKYPCQTLLASWSSAGADLQSALDDPMLLPPPTRSNALLRASIVNAVS